MRRLNDTRTDTQFFFDLAIEIEGLTAQVKERRQKAASRGGDPLAMSNVVAQRLASSATSAHWTAACLAKVKP